MIEDPQEERESVLSELRLLHEKVRASEARWRAIFDSEPECVKVLDSECRLLEMNRSGLSMIEAESIEQVRGRCVLDFIADEYHDRFRNSVDECLQGRNSLLKFQGIGLDGGRRWLEQHAVGLKVPGESDVINQILAITRDITAQVQATENDAQRLKTLTQLSNLSLKLSGDPGDVFEDIVRMIRELFAVRIVALSEIEGDLLRFELMNIDGNLIRNAGSVPLAGTPCATIETERDLRIYDRVAELFPEAEFLQRFGAVFYCGFPALDNDGNVVAVLCLLDDRSREFCHEDQQLLRLVGQRVATEKERHRHLDERNRARDAIRESQERLAEAQRIAHLGNWTWDLETDSLDWSDEVYCIFGHAPKSFVPRYEVEFLEAVHPDDRAKVTAAVQTALKTGKPYEMEHRILRHDGEQRVVRELGVVVADADSRLIAMTGTVQDVTERRHSEEQATKLREELAHLSRVGAIGELATGIAHELNQPLTAITNYACSIRNLLEGGQAAGIDSGVREIQSLAEKLEKQAVRAGDIIRGMQGLIRKRVRARTAVRIDHLINDVTSLLLGQLQLEQIELAVAVPDDLPEVLVDPIQIQQVVFNLCRNAIDSLRAKAIMRRLSITAAKFDDSKIEVRIRDWGAGIPEETARVLFTPFITSKPAGLGLGLTISRRIVESHGGKLWICSQTSPGAAFAFTLPVRFPE